MEQVFKSFSELASSAIAAHIQDLAPSSPTGNSPNMPPGHVIEASAQFTLASGDEETTAHIAISYVPE